MRQIAEMGDTSCGDFGCGAVTAEEIRGKGLRCRDASGSFTACPTARMGELGMFAKPGSSSVPDYGWGVVSTPNVRYPMSPTAARTWHKVHRKGAESLRGLFPGQTRIEHSFAGTAAQQAEAMRRAHEYHLARRRVAGFGDWGMGAGGFGQDFSGEAFRIGTPITVEPGKVILGNVIGSFLPALMDKGLERSSLSPWTKGLLRFSVGLTGVAGLLFFRRNSYVLGASLALFPGFVDAVATWVMGLIFKNGSAPSQVVVVKTENGEEVTVDMGQVSAGNRARLQRAAASALGRKVGDLYPKGFEAITPADYAALADSSSKVAGIGAPLGASRFRAIGE